MKLKLGLPKGSLQESTFAIFKKAGYAIRVGERSYKPSVDDPEIEAILIRAQEMSRYVESGVLDLGLTGKDWVVENGSDVHEIAELIYAKQGLRPIRWVIAVHNDSKFQKVEDLVDKKIATEGVNLTRSFLEKRGVKAHVEFSWGATEIKVPELVDAICEITETGSSLRANHLRIIETVLESTTRVIVNKKAWEDPWKRKKIENLALLLKGALMAEEKVGVKMNVPSEKLKEITSLLPALREPTISELMKKPGEKSWFAIETIVDEKIIRELIPKLKSKGAEGIIEYPLNKVIY
ncbi:MAG: ATP phosphoribosyltransferase [Chlamydiae bacterium]|nr:ATP phosphoribosyltransferase [Chlamydiota bacterium]MBI3277561.1 ATP phosphoribosyltransferase [Chlamydiota bacterium]